MQPLMQRRLWRRQVLRAALGFTAGIATAGCARAGARRRAGGQGSRPLSWLGRMTGFDGAGARLQAAVDSGEVHGAGLLVVAPQGTLYSASVGDFTPDHVDQIASATKLASATTIMSLVDAGALGLDDPVSRYLPAFGGAKAAITLRQCLSHTSGLPASSALLPPPGQDNGLTLAETVDRLARLPLLAAPGARFAYGGVSYQVAGRMAEVAAGASWSSLFQSRVVAPLQLTSFSYGDTTNPRIGGGASCSLADYGNLLLMHLTGGAFQGRQVLSEAAVREMQRSQTGAAPFQTLQQKREYGYGLAWWFDEVDGQGNATQVSDAGAFGAIPWLDLARGYGAFLFVRETLRAGVALYNALLPVVRQGVAG